MYTHSTESCKGNNIPKTRRAPTIRVIFHPDVYIAWPQPNLLSTKKIQTHTCTLKLNKQAKLDNTNVVVAFLGARDCYYSRDFL